MTPHEEKVMKFLKLLALTVFALTMCWAVVYGGKRVVERMIADGHPFLAVSVLLIMVILVSTGLPLYTQVTENIKHGRV